MKNDFFHINQSEKNVNGKEFKKQNNPDPCKT